MERALIQFIIIKGVALTRIYLSISCKQKVASVAIHSKLNYNLTIVGSNPVIAQEPTIYHERAQPGMVTTQREERSRRRRAFEDWTG